MRLETRGSEFWCSLDVVDVEKVGSAKRTLKLPIRKFSDRRFSVILGVEALTSLGLIKNTGPRSSTPDPGHASVDNSLLLPGVWPRGFTPSSPTSPEPQRPPLNLTIPSVPEIRNRQAWGDEMPRSAGLDSTCCDSDLDNIRGPETILYINLSSLLFLELDTSNYKEIKMGAIDRISQIGGQISGNPTAGGRDKILEKHPDDIVVTAACRTAFTKGGKGGFKDTQAADLITGVLKAILDRSKINPALVEDLCVGTVLAPGGGATEMRAASLAAGFPESIAVRSLNRQCSSGLQATVDVANQIKTGMIDIGIGAGVESMSLQYGPGAVTEFSELLESHPEAANCKVPMGVLSEQMAKDLNITRAAQDAFAASSYQKAVKAQKAGLFDEEIAPLTVKVEDKEGNIKEITVSKDDGVRDGITAESLGKIRPAFAKDGSIHAGNASQISDGAAAVLLMKRSTAEKLGQKILGKYVCASVVGVKPLLMGQGPWKAIPKALEQAGISKDDVDIWEINEAFASQCLWCANELGIPQEKINPKGGAIAFGHPLGCTGARQVSTLLYELKRTGQKVGATSMCVGTGMGMAAIWVAE
ncbi:Acetyl-CoA C-acetyltransferase [Fusarium keratoplasticum]|uniref:Acetyl-CoA C-acetyltransferase n=1 Tax=Fusarium keratoplasticum TaxID=1328300 RepID=A0ACC0RDK9_9HYPO|nr:Acetyl-CoA C-acetyltransferase [Fusarium keratoplasticum]KAI8680107.1 Acetyl-CoA C-acetyltransferase [Fusarium keratoplasticum]